MKLRSSESAWRALAVLHGIASFSASACSTGGDGSTDGVATNGRSPQDSGNVESSGDSDEAGSDLNDPAPASDSISPSDAASATDEDMADVAVPTSPREDSWCSQIGPVLTLLCMQHTVNIRWPRW